MENSNVSFLYMMTFIFIILKLTGVVTWPWWVVLLSLFYFSAILGVTLFVGAVALVVFNKNKNKSKNKKDKIHGE